MDRSSAAAFTLVVAGLAAIGVYLYYQTRAPDLAPPPVIHPRPAAPEAPAPQASAPVEPDIKHPLDIPADAVAPGAPDRDARWRAALAGLVGAKALGMFRTDAFARRTVATLDNLGRAHASPRLWPVEPAGGRFVATSRDGRTTVGADNAARYAPFVQIVAALDADRVATLYERMYPDLQAAYEEQGYPGRYFNDRVVEVIDLLLATPEPSGPPEVERIESKVAAAPAGGVYYRFADPALESLASGQKMLVRAGPAHARAVKAKLVELRARIARPSR